MTMDLKQLESFVRVAELGSFSRAAVALGIAQPLLSRHVRQLEVGYRQTFLLRNGRGVTLTDAGRLLLEHGRGILHQVALANEELGATRGALAGRVSMGLPPSLSKLITVPLTLAFRRRLPQAQLSLTEGFSVLMYEGLRSGRLDMAVLYDPPVSTDLERLVLHEEALVLIAGKGRAVGRADQQLPPSLALKQLIGLPLIIPSRPNAFRILIEAELNRVGGKPNIVLEVDGLNAILHLVKEGVGYAVLPAYTLRNFDDNLCFETHAIDQPTLMSQLTLVWSGRRPATATHKVSLELLAQIVKLSVTEKRPVGCA